MAVEASEKWLLLGSVAWGVSVAWASVLASDFLTRRGPGDGNQGAAEMERRRRLRNASRFFARFEPLIIPLSRWNEHRWPSLREWIGRTLISAGEEEMTAQEFLAVRQIQGVIFAVLAGMFGAWWQDSMTHGLGLFVMALVVSMAYSCWALHERAKRRRNAIAVRLPFAVDLIALILEAGGHFLDAVNTLAHEMEQHPLADELARLHRTIRLGISHHEALAAMSRRVGLPMLSEFVATVIQGEAGGTPLARIFRVQADQMRLKRSQAIEKATAKANVHMVYPGLISMLACLLVMAAQFVIWMMSVNATS